MNYLYVYDNKIMGKGGLKCMNEGYLNIEVDNEIYNNSEKYIYKDGTVVLDSAYPVRKLIEDKNKEIEAVKEELNELDLKSIRAIRANETDKILESDNKAKELRLKILKLNQEIESLK